jgi:tRNA pseudouridine synthase 9
VHLQYLGHPIANDVIYAEPQIWVRHLCFGNVLAADKRVVKGPELGKGGAPPINTRFVARSMHARSPPAQLPANVDALVHNLRALKVRPPPSRSRSLLTTRQASESAPSEATYWPRFRAAVLAAKEAVLAGSERPVAPLPQRRAASPDSAVPSTLPQLGPAAALASLEDVAPEPTEARLCADCRAPARADPRPEELCIFLHALRYEMELGAFETAPPAWASEGWVWGAPV